MDVSEDGESVGWAVASTDHVVAGHHSDCDHDIGWLLDVSNS